MSAATDIRPLIGIAASRPLTGSEAEAAFWTDAATGRFAVIGLALILVGVISHSSRRAGRREQEVIDRVRRA